MTRHILSEEGKRVYKCNISHIYLNHEHKNLKSHIPHFIETLTIVKIWGQIYHVVFKLSLKTHESKYGTIGVSPIKDYTKLFDSFIHIWVAK